MDFILDTSPDAILKLIGQGEGPTVEFKERLSADAIIARTLSAQANSGGGVVIIGVDDEGQPTGLSGDEAASTLSRLISIAASLLPAPHECGIIELPDNRNLVYLVVNAIATHLAPVTTATGEAYVRDGAIDVLATLPDVDGSSTPAQTRIIVFVAMSFRDEEEPTLVDYFEAMKRAITRSNRPLEVTRIDLQEGDYEISQEVMDAIDRADVVIADFTLSPANVYFELGYARGRQKRVIQTARSDTTLEFDVRNWRTLFYRNATELEEKLIPALVQAYDEVIR